MRFIILPNFANPYDQRMIYSLAAALNELGHVASPLAAPLPADTISTLARRTNADVVMQVNRVRPFAPPLPPNVRHIAWFQDVFPDTVSLLAPAEREGDIVYALGDAGVLGLNIDLPCQVGSLLTGVDPALLNVARPRTGRSVDFTLCGYIPHQL